MEPFIFPVIATLAGSFFLIRNIIHLRDEKKLREYVESSPKAKLWIKKFGLEKTITLTKQYFLPLGILVSCGLIGVGLWSILILVQSQA
ncbi:hypothetical protein [Methylobacter tundripaludum]|uniref:hypothetical protein n=1 Tax=Methylobacter tundripaludum TaxID=173365 RepID=UPI00048A3DC7|nr:hypothetical protein [Methylobacter tundripaludum]